MRLEWYEILLGKHAQAAGGLGEVTTRNLSGGLSADTELEASRAPVDELNRLLGLDGGDSVLCVLGTDVTPVQQAARHVLALLGVALDHLASLLEAGVGHVQDRVLLVESFVGGDEGSEGGEGEVDTGGRAPSWSGTRSNRR